MGIASYALLVQRVPWIDQKWDTPLQGSSRNMKREDVHYSASLEKIFDVQCTKLASSCKSIVESCEKGGCGTITLEKAKVAFSRMITHVSLLEPAQDALIQSRNRTRLLERVGLTAFDGEISMLALVFQELNDVNPADASAGNDTSMGAEIGVEGIEMLLLMKLRMWMKWEHNLLLGTLIQSAQASTRFLSSRWDIIFFTDECTCNL